MAEEDKKISELNGGVPRVPEPGFLLPAEFEDQNYPVRYEDFVGPTGPQGETGDTGPTGDDGANGWSPVFAAVSDGARRVLRVTDWTGGSGSKPATGKYVGASGLVDAIGEGIDVRGPAGSGGGGQKYISVFLDFALDLSGNTDVEVFQTNGASWGDVVVSTVDVTGCTALKIFSASGGSAAPIGLNTAVSLEAISISHFAELLTSIDLASNILLQTLVLQYNHLSSVDLSANANLKFVDCSNCQIETVDVLSCSLLRALFLANNQISAIDLSGNPALTQLDLTGNPLSTLDISGNPLLVFVYASSAALSEGSVDLVLAHLDLAGLSDGEVDLSDGTNAPPSATGLAAKASLESKGWTVSVNS